MSLSNNLKFSTGLFSLGAGKDFNNQGGWTFPSNEDKSKGVNFFQSGDNQQSLFGNQIQPSSFFNSQNHPSVFNNQPPQSLFGNQTLQTSFFNPQPQPAQPLPQPSIFNPQPLVNVQSSIFQQPPASVPEPQKSTYNLSITNEIDDLSVTIIDDKNQQLEIVMVNRGTTFDVQLPVDKKVKITISKHVQPSFSDDDPFMLSALNKRR